MKKFYSTIILVTLGIGLFAGATINTITPVYAADTPIAKEYTLLEPLPCIEGEGSKCVKGETIQKIEISQYINYMFRLMIALAIFLAIFMFTYGAFEYMTSEAVGSKSDAKQRMWNSVLGVVAALASYLILYTIDPRLVQINAAVPAINVKNLEPVDLGSSINNINELMHRADIDAAKALSEAEAYRVAAASTRNQAETLNTTYGCSAGGAAASEESAAQCAEYIRLLKQADLQDDKATITAFKESTRTHYYIALAPQNTWNAAGKEVATAEINNAIKYAEDSYAAGLDQLKDQSNKQLYEDTVGVEKNLEVESLKFLRDNTLRQLNSVGKNDNSTVAADSMRDFEIITKEKILKDPKNEQVYLRNQVLINNQIRAIVGDK
ncbi:MAG: hypothetical protein RIT04_209 [Candidatus Parcubacteria bacterium]|jgi:hypothetical protein